MKKIKLYKNKIIAIITSISLMTTLVSCSSGKEEQSKEIKQSQTVNNEIKIDKNSNINEKSQTADEVTYKYIEDMKNDINNNFDDEENISNKIKVLIDFTFNGGKIGGYTFDDLTEECKQNVIESVIELDSIIDKYVPNYKDRVKGWLKEKKEQLHDFIIDKSVDVKETWNTYKEDINREYEKRQKIK